MTIQIDLPKDGRCPCGGDQLTQAEDFTRYTPYTKHPNTGWQAGEAWQEVTDSRDPLGGVRLFCAACGQYFNLPEELK